MSLRTLIAASLLAGFACLGLAQTPKLEPNTSTPALPIVSFDFVLKGAVPPHYSMAVEPDGKATYRADEVQAAGSVPLQPYQQQFLLSAPTRTRIFHLALALHCFKGEFEFHGGRVANMGAKTLKCTYAGRVTMTEYNYTTNRQLQELTAIFQDISNTMEFTRRLAYLHRFDKLGLEEELKAMEGAEKDHRLAELQAAAPELEKIFNDPSVMNVSRRRAEHLLQLVKSNPAARAALPQ